MRAHRDRDTDREAATVQRQALRRPAQDPRDARMPGLQESAGNDAVAESLTRIGLPDPSTGKRVVLQTVPDIDYIEAGGQNLRWHEKDSVKERQSEHEVHQKIEIPVTALKGRHTQIINGILETGRRTRAKAGRAEEVSPRSALGLQPAQLAPHVVQGALAAPRYAAAQRGEGRAQFPGRHGVAHPAPLVVGPVDGSLHGG